MRRFLAVMVVFLAGPALADEAASCKHPSDVAAQTACAKQEADKADAALAELLARLSAAAVDSDKEPGSPGFGAALAAAQQAWEGFRSAECSWQSLEAHGTALEGLIAPLCKAKLTRQRILQLETGASE